MTDEERQHQMDFILSQQAQFAADIQKLQEAQAKIIEAQAKMIEAQEQSAQIVNRLAAVTVEGFNQINGKLNILIDAQTRAEGALTKLAEAQAHTDRRLDALIDIVREGRNGKS